MTIPSFFRQWFKISVLWKLQNKPDYFFLMQKACSSKYANWFERKWERTRVGLGECLRWVSGLPNVPRADEDSHFSALFRTRIHQGSQPGVLQTPPWHHHATSVKVWTNKMERKIATFPSDASHSNERHPNEMRAIKRHKPFFKMKVVPGS